MVQKQTSAFLRPLSPKCKMTDGSLCCAAQHGIPGCKVTLNGLHTTRSLFCCACCCDREDRARRLKQRRRQWLLKMYRAGMQDSTACENRTGACSQTAQSSYAAAAAVGGARHLGSQPLSSSRLPADGQTGSCSEEERILQLLEQQMLNEATDNTIMNSSMMGDSSSGDAAHDGWDVEELVALGLDAGILAWSQKLDFDSYQQHWNSTAVTLGSSVCVPVSEKAAA